MVILEYKHPRSHSRFATFMHFQLPLFSVLTKDSTKCFWVSNGIKSLVPILYSHEGLDFCFSYSLILTMNCFFLSPFSILKTKCSFLAIVPFYPPFILNSQQSMIFLSMPFSILIFSTLFAQFHCSRFSILIASMSSSLFILYSQCYFYFSHCETIFLLSVLHSQEWLWVSWCHSLFSCSVLFLLNLI